MASSAAVDTVVTVKQHGFVVKEGPPVFHRPSPSPAAESAGRGDDASSGAASAGSGLTRATLGLLSSARTSGPATTPAATPPTAPGLAPTADYGVSPGLPRAGNVRPADYAHLTPGVKRLMRSVMRGLKAHQDPEAATEGLGGTYFFRNEGGVKIAIMKPCDEEPLAPNNPKGFVGRRLGEPGLKPTVRVGEAASREVAAYLLDHDHFARVPHTVMVRMAHPVFHVASGNPSDCPTPSMNANADDEPAPMEERLDSDVPPSVDMDDELDLPLKLGSLQEYAPHECDTSEMGASRFTTRDVQRIGILDIRLFNTDRHAGNILVRRVHSSGTGGDALAQPYELIPIDHGFALPEALEPPYFEWQHWPQALMPFGAEELAYIARLDPRADSDLLRRELPGLREESLRLLEVSTTLLKRCAAAGLSLSEIAGVVTRPLIGLEDEPSPLELLCADVREEMEAERAADMTDDDDDGSEYSSDAGSESEGEEEEAAAGSDAVMTAAAGSRGGPRAPVLRRLGTLEEGAEGEEDAEEAVEESSEGTPSPGADSASTHFQFDREEEYGATAARRAASAPPLDDALFAMDEEGGVRSPMATSPDAFPLARLAAPSLVVKRTGEVATPGGVVGISFGSALASSDSLPASYDSDGAGGEADAPRVNSLDSTEASVGAAFTKLAASFVPGGFASAAKPAPRRSGKAPRRSRAGRGGRKAPRAQAYPPLVQPRGPGGAAGVSTAAAGVFSGLSDAEWDEYLSRFEGRVEEALRRGDWVQSALGGMNGPAPLMSCPKF